ETGDRLVAAMSAARLNAWIDACRALGADPERVYLAATIWPAPDGAVEIVEHDDAAMVAGGKLGGFAIEAGLAPAIAARWLEPLRNEISAINLCVRDGDAWSRALGPNAAPVERGAVDDFALVLARSARAAPAHAPNLRQGALARVTSQRQWRLWRFAAVLALLALLLQVGSLIAAGWQDARAARETLAQAARDLSEARPDVGRVVNVRAQARALVNAIDQAGNHPVLAINAALIEVLETQPLVRLDEVRHAAPGRSVQLRLSSTDAAALEAAARALRAGGLTVEARAVTQADGRYQSELSAESP
ncbi:MAG: type II secretion system protein GspL, partial [Hyphomonadaceae bacterium]